MKRVIIFLLLLSTFASKGQIYQKVSTWEEYLNRLRVTGMFRPPLAPISNADTGSVYYNKADSSYYKWTGNAWRNIADAIPASIPGIYFSPSQNFDPTFVVYASAAVYPSNVWSFGATIEWGMLDYNSEYSVSFFDSVGANPSTVRLKVFHPNVKNILNTVVTTDEHFSTRLTTVGTLADATSVEIPLYNPQSIGLTLLGNGTTTWTENFQNMGLFLVDNYNTANGQTRFDVPASTAAVNLDPNGVNIHYIGSNGYTIKRQYSGTGIYTVAFTLNDAFGNPVTTAPTSSDEVMITNGGMVGRQLNAYQYNAGNQWFADIMNLWVTGAFECWLVASPISTTNTLVRWQTNYPSATNYKIYRSATKHGTRTLVHTGTSGSYTDTGLTPATHYYYHLVAVVGGVDTYVTYFTTNTK